MRARAFGSAARVLMTIALATVLVGLTIATPVGAGGAAPSSTSSAFAVLAAKTVTLGPSAVVRSGDVGANAARGRVSLANRARVAGRVMASTVALAEQSSVGAVTTNSLQGKGTVRGDVVKPVALPLAEIAPVTSESATAALVIDKPTRVPAGAYGPITVLAGGVARLGGSYDAQSLDVRQGGRVVFEAASDLRLTRSLRLARDTSAQPARKAGITASAIAISVAKGGDAAVQIGRDARIDANLRAPAGTITVDQGAHVAGALHARDVSLARGVVVNHEPPAGEPTTGIDPRPLVAQLAAAQTLDARSLAVQQILAAAGIATGDETGVILYPAVAPATQQVAWPADVVSFGLDTLRDRENQLTGDDFAGILADAGWPFDATPSVGEQLLTRLRAWATEANANPSDPMSFAGRYLAASLAARGTALTDPGLEPDEAWFTKLDVVVFGAALQRLLTLVPTGASEKPQPANADSCTSVLEDWLGEVFGPQVASAYEYANGKLLEAVMGEDGAEKFGHATLAIDLASKFAKLALRYHAVAATLTPDVDQIHKPVPLDGDRFTYFRLDVGIDDEAWTDYTQRWSPGSDKVLSDCLSAAGLPEIPDLGNITDAIEKWRVDWDDVEGLPTHATIPLAPQNDFVNVMSTAVKMQEGSLHKAESGLVVEIAQEKAIDHDGGGQLLTAPVTVLAQVETDAPPSVSVFTDALWGQLLAAVASSADLLAGWFQNEWTTDRQATVDVQYEKPGVGDYDVKITYKYTDGGTPGAPTSHLTGDLVVTGRVVDNANSSQFTAIGSGSVNEWAYGPNGSMVLSCHGTWTFNDEVVADGYLHKESNAVRVLVLDPRHEPLKSDGCDNTGYGAWVNYIRQEFVIPDIGETRVFETTRGSTGSDRYSVYERIEITGLKDL